MGRERAVGMLNTPVPATTSTQKRHIKVILFLAIIVGLMTAVTAIRAIYQPRKHSVFPCYYLSGVHWSQRQSLYDKVDMNAGVDVFRYHPAFAVLMVPWAVLPENYSGMVWRVFGGCCLGIVMVAALKAESERISTGFLALAGIPWIVCSMTSLNNGQLNVELVAAVAGATLLATRHQFNACGALLGLAVIMKMFPIAYLGLFALILPWRMLAVAVAVIVALFGVPLIAAPTDYALQEYQSWFSFLGRDDRSAYALKDGYRDLWMLWRLSGLPIDRSVYMVIQILVGLALVLPVIWAHIRMDHRSQCRLVFGLATGWILLLGPSTESSTYILMGPWLFWAISTSCRNRRGFQDAFLYGSIACLVLSAVGGLFKGTGEWHALGWHPGSALFLVTWEMAEFIRCSKKPSDDTVSTQGSR